MARLLTVILAVVLVAGEATATTFISGSWQEEYAAACTELQIAATLPGACVLCHTSGGGSGDLNPYALDMKAVHDQGGTWSEAMAAIESDDSDGDTVDNVTEILTDCTLPGDPTSVPTEEHTWSQIKDYYR